MRTQGDAQVQFSSIPKGQPMAHYESTCPSACISTFGGDITLFHSFPHMHSYGREIFTVKYANDGTSTVVSHKQFWTFAQQSQINGLNVKVTSTDKLSTHCIYDVSPWLGCCPVATRTDRYRYRLPRPLAISSSDQTATMSYGGFARRSLKIGFSAVLTPAHMQ
jgi:hypothetical protein